MKRLLWSPLLLLPLLALAGCDMLTDPTDPPGRPTGVSAEGRSMSSVLVVWSAASSGGEAGEYEVERAPAGGSFSRVATPGGGTLSYTDTGLQAEATYRYRVRACNGGGCSEYSAAATATTFGVLAITTETLPSGAVGQPYNEALAATGTDGNQTWSVVSGALPSGVVLDGETGLLSGTPDTEETAQFTVEARSIDDQTDQATYTVDIGAPLALQILNVALPPVIVDGSYDVALRSYGGAFGTTWSLAAGTLPAGLTLDPAGRIEGSPTATDTAAITLRAESAGDADEASYELVVVSHDPGRFDVTFMPVADVPAEIRPHLDSARTRWEQVITGDLEPGSIAAGTFSNDFCGGFGEEVNGTTLDDVIMMVNIAPIDGPGGTLGRAGPCGLRTGGPDSDLPIVGTLTLDSNDLLPIAGSSSLTDLIFHEMAHILGFGTLWDRLGLLQSAGTAFPTYTGEGGVAEYHALGGTGLVPVESGGGLGTAGGHWRESTFGSEIMTGFISPFGDPNPLSRVTIASMDDMGYAADRSEADQYSLASALRLGPALENLGYDEVVRGPVILLGADGTVERDTLQ